MRRLVLLPLLIAGCAAPHRPLHEIGALAAGQWAWCMEPDGEIVAWDETGEPSGGRCEAPRQFVLVPGCADGQPSHDESPMVKAARARLGADGSLYGDRFEGLAFCAPRPPS